MNINSLFLYMFIAYNLFHLQPINEERKRSWDMVVDTASLLNKESRKALQLLQGLKGTRLIIPQSGINIVLFHVTLFEMLMF